MIDKWNYKSSILSGIFFILTFLIKEVFLYINLPILGLLVTYILLIIFNVFIFFAYIKYSILNDKKFLLYSTISLISSNILMIALECLSYGKLIEISKISIISANIIMCITLFAWSLSIIIKGVMYGRSLFLLGIVGILLAATFVTPIFSYMRLPFYLLFYILVIFPFVKKNKKSDKIRLLRR